MPAVSDSGPLIHLAQVQRITLLRNIFGEIIIVPAVKREVIDEGIRRAYTDAQLVADAIAEGYIVVHRTGSRMSNRASKLAKEEGISETDSQTLLLAKAMKKPILTDEKVLSILAKMYGLEVWNTWTVLFEALRTKLINRLDIEKAISELGEKRHKVSHKDAKQILDAANRIT